jgi:D-alanyl-lipoteichoic acid acyltransferase DltB (MBOAT superfamily)
LFTWGLYKKIVIADNLAKIADPVFSNPGQYHSMDLIAALIAFMFQIYCDFSGYSDMARALARALGFDILLNFRLPYFSRTPSEFWKKWHISLSSWLRDYLYIPLGGSHGGKLKTYRNLTATMLLGGLWHGAAWNFILWGAYQGLLLAAYRLCKVDGWLARNEGLIQQKLVSAFVLWPAMILFIAYGWLLFRAQSLESIVTYTQGMLGGNGGSLGQLEEVLLKIAPLIVVQCYQQWRGELEVFGTLPWFIRLNCGLFVFFSLLFLAAGGENQFLYFDF